MKQVFAETSFLFPLYRAEVHTDKAISVMKDLGSPLPISGLVALEFRQAIRFQNFLHSKDPSIGIPNKEAGQLLQMFNKDIQDGIFRILPVDWLQAHAIADSLGSKHVPKHGHRIMDILHVATALHLGAKDFLSFDKNQGILASSEDLKLPV